MAKVITCTVGTHRFQTTRPLTYIRDMEYVIKHFKKKGVSLLDLRG